MEVVLNCAADHAFVDAGPGCPWLKRAKNNHAGVVCRPKLGKWNETLEFKKGIVLQAFLKNAVFSTPNASRISLAEPLKYKCLLLSEPLLRGAWNTDGLPFHASPPRPFTDSDTTSQWPRLSCKPKTKLSALSSFALWGSLSPPTHPSSCPTTSTSSRSITQGVLTMIFYPNYSTKTIGNAICAARKFEALNLSGQKTWNPLVKVRRQMKDRTAYVAYGWSSVLYGRVWKSLWCSNAARKRR